MTRLYEKTVEAFTTELEQGYANDGMSEEDMEIMGMGDAKALFPNIPTRNIHSNSSKPSLILRA